MNFDLLILRIIVNKNVDVKLLHERCESADDYNIYCNRVIEKEHLTQLEFSLIKNKVTEILGW